MLLELGNHGRANAIDSAPAVTYVSIPDTYAHEVGIDVVDFTKELAGAALKRGGITRLPGHEAALAVAHPGGLWSRHSDGRQLLPAWVNIADPGIDISRLTLDEDGHIDPLSAAFAGPHPGASDLERLLSEYFECPRGRPSMLEDLYHTRFGPPGVGAWANPVEALITNAGRTLMANMLGGGQVGLTGAATATSSTSLTSGAVTSVSANQFAGYRIYAGSVWANIISHTSGTTPVFTVDQWYVPSSPGGSAGSTPSSSVTYLIADGGSVSAWFVGITSTNITPGATDTSLSGEQTTNGLSRKIAPFALTSGTSPMTYTLTPVFTYTGSSAVTLYAIAGFVSNVKTDTTDNMLFETPLSSSATVSANGDQLTVTETLTGP